MKVIDPVYLPFSAEDLEPHFRFAAWGKPQRHVDRFLARASGDGDRRAELEPAPGAAADDPRLRRIERDETFWTAACLLAIFSSHDPVENFIDLLRRAFGSSPPIPAFGSWHECFEGEPALFFEVGLSSPASYRAWLREHVGERNLIPYARERALRAGTRLEGRTHLDAMLIVPETGFAVHFEAKVLSDVDTKVSYDVMRNQIARNVDAMLEPPGRHAIPPLSQRDPDRSLFALLTSRVFQKAPWSRLYGWLMNEYMDQPAALARDLPHRTEVVQWSEVSDRLGWLTWEDYNEVLPGSCPWLETPDGGSTDA